MDEPVIFSTFQLATLLGLTEERVRTLSREGIMPSPVSRGRFELYPSVLGYINYLRGKKAKIPAGNAAPDQLDGAHEKARLYRIQADARELEYRVATKELIPSADVSALLAELATMLKMSLDGSLGRDRAAEKNKVLAAFRAGIEDFERDRLLAPEDPSEDRD